MKVWNKRDPNCPKNAVYVGRPSKWGNPYKVSLGRLECIRRFREYAIQRLEEESTWLDELKGKDLVCWCAPLPCHANVLMELIDK